MRLYSLIALGVLVLAGCSSAVPVRIISHYDLTAIPHDDLVSEKDAGSGDLRTERIKYLVRLSGASPSASINNHAIELCVQGKFTEAEILLLQIPASDGNAAAVSNNLGVVYECSRDFTRARSHYLDACAGDPDCGVYRHNLRTADSREK